MKSRLQNCQACDETDYTKCKVWVSGFTLSSRICITFSSSTTTSSLNSEIIRT